MRYPVLLSTIATTFGRKKRGSTLIGATVLIRCHITDKCSTDRHLQSATRQSNNGTRHLAICSESASNNEHGLTPASKRHRRLCARRYAPHPISGIVCLAGTNTPHQRSIRLFLRRQDKAVSLRSRQSTTPTSVLALLI